MILKYMSNTGSTKSKNIRAITIDIVSYTKVTRIFPILLSFISSTSNMSCHDDVSELTEKVTISPSSGKRSRVSVTTKLTVSVEKDSSRSISSSVSPNSSRISSMVTLESMINVFSFCCSISSDSWSVSSRISPNTSSKISSKVTIPATQPYSSITRAICF